MSKWIKGRNRKDRPPAERKKEGGPKFLALARVSSREQQREGFSLDVQEDGIKRYVAQRGGEIVKLYKVAETASKTSLRVTFQEMLAEARRRAHEIDAILFYKYDRAARNIFDYVELERLEKEYGVCFQSVCEPTEDSAAGRFHRRTLFNVSTFNVERQTDDVREGIERRVVENGLVPSKAPYGYSNVRRDGRSTVEVCEAEAAKVRRIFRMYAYEGYTLDAIATKLNAESVIFTQRQPRWHKSQVHRLLLNRAYIGEIIYHGQWYKGVQTPLVDRETWDKVQTLLGHRVYTNHELTYAGGVITCAFCNHLVTGERIKKKKTGRMYVYYRCAQNNLVPNHPKCRVREADIDKRVLETFDRLHVSDPGTRAWIERVLRARTIEDREAAQKKIEDLEGQLAKTKGQRKRLFEMRMDHEIEKDDFLSRDTQLRDDEARFKLLIEAAERDQAENIDVAVKAFELAQNLRKTWGKCADSAAKRNLMKIVFLNSRLDGVNLVFDMRKPFDILSDSVSVSLSQDGRTRTCMGGFPKPVVNL